MSILKRAGMWFGGAMLFFGLLSFITLFSLNTSGVLSPQYFNSALSQIINSSASPSITGNSALNSTQITYLESLLGTFQANNPNCNVLCLVSQKVGNQTNLSAPLTASSLNLYQIIIELMAVLGAVLIFFSYPDKYTKLTAFGRIPLSVAIISFVSTYIPLMFVVPYLFSGLKIGSFTLSVPASVVTPFTSVVIVLDIVFGVIGITLLIISAILLARKRRLSQKPLSPTQLQVKKE